ncbi:MAG: GNAT family N-acetyltransferase [Cyclobacteriaceae bacterium]
MHLYKCLSQQEVLLGNYSVSPIQRAEIEAIRIWRNAQIEVLRQKEQISQQDQVLYFETNVWPTLNEDQPEQILFSYFKNDVAIGYGGLVHINWDERSCELSFLLNPQFTKNDEDYEEYLTRFISLMKSVAFGDLDFDKLFTETYAIRRFHISVLEKCGFKHDRTMRSKVVIDNKSCDSLIHMILNM